jgi:glycosyltransferase involved in cell wall biosynthesis
MRIVHLTVDWQPTGGISSYVRLLAPAQAAAGHDVLVIHAGDVTEDEGCSPTTGVHVRALTNALRLAPDEGQYVSPVLEAIDAFKPDIAHFHGSDNFSVENAVRARVPSLKTMHNLLFCPAGTKYHGATGKACELATGILCVPRQGYLRCTTSKRPSVWWRNYQYTVRANAHNQTHTDLIVTSEYVRRTAAASGFDRTRISVVPYFTTVPASVPPVTTRNVLYVGRLSREKGPDLVLEAMALVPGDSRAVIIGDGIDMGYLHKRADALGLTDRVDFRGWLNGAALEDEYRRAAIVVVPSRLPEPFGITGIEALAWARPVVAFGVGGIPEWLTDGVGGFCVPGEDVGAMAQRIRQLLDDPSMAHEVGARGRARAERDFAVGPHLANLAPIYSRVMSRPVGR